ncbi:MAG: phospholipase [Chloroflexi bacterium]|nr:MAG: phospholipase [Chloroflexota bacterium]
MDADFGGKRMINQVSQLADEQATAARDGRLSILPRPPAASGAVGPQSLGLGTARDGWLYVPASYDSSQPAPLLVFLHGAGGSAQRGRRLFQFIANRTGLLVVTPESRGRTWDRIRGSFGADVMFIEQALTRTFTSYAVDLSHMAIAGFSDGASYALALGLTNGDLFTHIIALSPGFAAPGNQHGRPRLFITHGTRDTVLPIDRCSRRIVPHLRAAGYDVQYREFGGPHIIQPWIAWAAIRWFMLTPR